MEVNQSRYSNSITDDVDDGVEFEDEDFRYSTSWFQQFYTLLRRGIYMTLKDSQVL
jgi:hypothetical protein